MSETAKKRESLALQKFLIGASELIQKRVTSDSCLKG